MQEVDMEQAIRRRVIVEPGGRIVIQSDELPEGAEAEVIVLLAQPRHASYAVMLGSGQGTLATPEEADAFLRRERDAWE